MNAIQDIATVQTFHFVREELVEAPPEVVFQAVLDELGPEGQMPDGTSLKAKIEAWPGGRWFRDFGNNTGHLWGHVQVIKPPALIELCGPMFMSYPAINHVQYRITPEARGARLSLVHKALGLIPKEHMEGMNTGWGYKFNRAIELAKRKANR